MLLLLGFPGEGWQNFIFDLPIYSYILTVFDAQYCSMVRLIGPVWYPPFVVCIYPIKIQLLGLEFFVLESRLLWVLGLVGYYYFSPLGIHIC